MTQEPTPIRIKPAVEATYKSYSKSAPEDDGYELTVTSDATPEDVNRTIQLAAHARLMARLALLAGDDIEDQDLAELPRQSVENLLHKHTLNELYKTDDGPFNES